MFNLSAPPHFRGLDPYKPVTSYVRHLPHWRQDGATYFATFRLGDALPNSKLQYLTRLREEWNRAHPPPRTSAQLESYARMLFQQEEAWLDEGHGACHFYRPKLAEVLAEALLHFQDQRYFTSCWTIMPNHCHVVIRPFEKYSLETLLQGIKGTVARRVNLLIGGSGSLWQDESYDRIIRNEEHLWRVIQYIGRNPARAGLQHEQWRRWMAPSWQAAGWRFVDGAGT